MGCGLWPVLSAFCKLSIEDCQEVMVHGVDKGELLDLKGDLTVLWESGS